MTRRVLLVHNGRILAEGDVREIRDLLDEHPHTVALRARDPRRLAAAIIGWPNVLSVSLRRRGRVAHRADGAARRVLPRAARRRPSSRAWSRCTRPTRTWSRCSATWWPRDEGHQPAVAVRGRRPRGLLPVARRHGLDAAQPADGGARRAAGRVRGPLPARARGEGRRAADHPARPLRGDRLHLLDPQRAAARRAVLRHLARRRRGGRAHARPTCSRGRSRASSIFVGKFAAYLATTLDPRAAGLRRHLLPAALVPRLRRRRRGGGGPLPRPRGR